MLASVLRSLLFYRRVNIVVASAVMISTAVIGGAMIVGDSVRSSLKQMTLQRLGQVTHVVQGPFVRERLAADLQERSGAQVAPAVMLTAGLERHAGDSVYRAGSVEITGISKSGWALLDTAGAAVPDADGIVLGDRCARALKAGPGDVISVWAELPSSIPRDSLLGERDQVSAEMQFRVQAVLPDTVGASRFTLKTGQQLPFCAFVSLAALQERLGLAAVPRSRRHPIARPSRINTLLIHADGETSDEQLTEAVGDALTPDDLSLRLRVDEDRGYISAETDRMILSTAVSDAVIRTASRLGLRTAPTLVYLINEFAAADRTHENERYSMYSIVAGLPVEATAPLGPFGSSVPDDDEIILSDWLADDLKVGAGDAVTARWHEVGSHGELPEQRKRFRVAEVLPEDDRVSRDPGLTPFIPGVTDVDSFSEWDEPFPMETSRITPRDDEYWSRWRAAPKAFVSLETARKLWSSRYGEATSIRIAGDRHPLPEGQLAVIARTLAKQIPRQCGPDRFGLMPRPVLAEGLQAAVGANDFTQLFAGFSFFLILSAVLLASLMFRLGVQTRISQAGLLHAVGWSQRQVRWFFLCEGLIVAAVGTVPGMFLAAGFARMMIYGLTTWWIGAVGTRFLILDVRMWKLPAAAAAALLLTAIVIHRAVRGLERSSVRDLLQGKSAPMIPPVAESRRDRRLTATAFFIGTALPLAAAGGVLPAGEAFAGLTWTMVAFFTGGTALLAAGLLLLRLILRSVSRLRLRHLSALAVASAARSPQRSLLTTALIACATFLIVAVAAGRRNPLSETPDLHSGNGGFRLVAESSHPILHDIGTAAGREAVNLTDRWEQSELSDTVSIWSFSMRPGEDASCRNLYQTRLPTLLGADDGFLNRGGFRFANTPGDNPWQLLRQDLPSERGRRVIPVIGDMNTLMYSLKKGLGDSILYPDEQNPTAELRIVGMLDGSLFQGVLVMTRDHLQKLDPDVVGSRWFLAETASDSQARILADVLESGLSEYGIDTEPVAERLAGFLAVQNTYLSTFQLLGGLGLLIGIFGLAVVMVRNVVERQAEIALLRALGFSGLRIGRLIVTENIVLLVWGMLPGTLAALLAMLPHLMSTGADLPWVSLTATLGGVAAAGLAAAGAAVRRAQQISVRDGLTVDT